PSFIAINSASWPVMAVITVIPSINGCLGNAKSFTITVNKAITTSNLAVYGKECFRKDSTGYYSFDVVQGAAPYQYTVKNASNVPVVTETIYYGTKGGNMPRYDQGQDNISRGGISVGCYCVLRGALFQTFTAGVTGSL